MAGILGSVWCVLNGTGNLIGGVIGDYVGRKKQISMNVTTKQECMTLTLKAIGLATLVVLLICLCITTDLYAGSTNKAGKTAAAVFTFLMIAV